MWKITSGRPVHLSHDLLCLSCGHAVHTYLPCSETCSCPPCAMPGSVAA